MPRATDLLREDHNKVKDLFRRFEDTDDEQERRAIAKQAIMELEIHAQIEEEIFYPAIRRKERGDEEMVETMDEADEEHHVATMLMEELKTMRSGGSKFAAKFTVLAENVKHHIQEEETEILTKAAENGESFLQDLGSEMEVRKMELMESYGKNGRSRNGAGRKPAGSSARKSSAKKAAASRSNGRKTTARKKGAAATRVSATRKKSATRSTAKKSSSSRKRASRSR